MPTPYLFALAVLGVVITAVAFFPDKRPHPAVIAAFLLVAAAFLFWVAHLPADLLEANRHLLR
jgi:hypothetical protein